MHCLVLYWTACRFFGALLWLSGALFGTLGANSPCVVFPAYLVVLVPDWRTAFEMGSSLRDILCVEREVMMTGLYGEWGALATGIPDDGESISRGEMDDVAWDPVHSNDNKYSKTWFYSDHLHRKTTNFVSLENYFMLKFVLVNCYLLNNLSIKTTFTFSLEWYL